MILRSMALLLAAASLYETAIMAGSAQAAQEKVGDTQMCVPLQNIASTPVIDDHTLLIEMHGGKYKRMDLAGPCPGLDMGYGYIHSTSINQLCDTDTLKVNQVAGATCMIKQIVTISAEEAKELKKKK